MTQKEKKQLALDVAAALESLYPEAECALEWGGKEPWRLLVMSRLSAQCTDKKVNDVSRTLFLRYPTMEQMAEADIAELESIIRPCGLYRMKAKNIVESLRQLIGYGRSALALGCWQEDRKSPARRRVRHRRDRDGYSFYPYMPSPWVLFGQNDRPKKDREALFTSLADRNADRLLP